MEVCVADDTIEYTVTFANDTGAYLTDDSITCDLSCCNTASSGNKWEATFVSSADFATCSEVVYTPYVRMDERCGYLFRLCSIVSHVMSEGPYGCDSGNRICMCEV